MDGAQTPQRTAQRSPADAHVAELRRRAAALARVPGRQSRQDVTPVVIFQLADEQYALAASVVLQVHVLRDLTPLAGARAPLFGITHWRGSVLTILDLRAQLGVRTHGVTDLSRVIVVDGPRQPFGILADAARDFIDLNESDVRPLPPEMAERGLLRGMTDDAILVMDTDAVLAAGRMVAEPDE